MSFGGQLEIVLANYILAKNYELDLSRLSKILLGSCQLASVHIVRLIVGLRVLLSTF